MTDGLSVATGSVRRVSRYNPYAVLRHRPGWTLGCYRLPMGEMGRWYPDLETMLIDSRLTQAERRSTVAHEVEHALNGDECHARSGPDGHRLNARTERRAERDAARKLIPLDVLADELAWAGDEWEIAEALWVDVQMVRARIAELTDVEKRQIERRIAAKGEAA